eukprot:1140853-Pelagomonas_calceolata.AAC.5
MRTEHGRIVSGLPVVVASNDSTATKGAKREHLLTFLKRGTIFVNKCAVIPVVEQKMGQRA